LSKLAKLANVSVSTASKAFSMSREVNNETREYIFRVAKEQGCFKKFFNAKYPKPVVAVLCPELHSQAYAMQVRFLKEELEKRDCTVCVSSYDFQTQTAAELIGYYERYTSVDAVVSLGALPSFVGGHEIPLFVCGSDKEGVSDVQVRVDIVPALTEIADMFLAAGRRDIVFIGEPLTRSIEERFREILLDRGCDWRCVITTERFEKGGYAAMQQLLGESLPQAVLCAYDYMAYGALRCAHDHGLRVPQDLMVAGINNLPESAYMVPSLTSVDNQPQRVAEKLATAVTQLFAGEIPPSHIQLSATVVKRESAQ
jgi:DNA-binding LacI/PurR family transcriptional regulator